MSKKKPYVCTVQKFFKHKRYALTYSVYHDDNKPGEIIITHVTYLLYDRNLLPKELKNNDAILPYLDDCIIDERTAYNPTQHEKIKKSLLAKKRRLENKHKEEKAYLKSIKDYIKHG